MVDIKCGACGEPISRHDIRFYLDIPYSNHKLMDLRLCEYCAQTMTWHCGEREKAID